MTVGKERRYRVTYSCYKDGCGWEGEKIITANSVVDAVEKMEEDFGSSYIDCEVISVVRV